MVNVAASDPMVVAVPTQPSRGDVDALGAPTQGIVHGEAGAMPVQPLEVVEIEPFPREGSACYLTAVMGGDRWGEPISLRQCGFERPVSLGLPLRHIAGAHAQFDPSWVFLVGRTSSEGVALGVGWRPLRLGQIANTRSPHNAQDPTRSEHHD